MKKNYQKPEIIEEIELDRKVVYASREGEGGNQSGAVEGCGNDNPDC